MRRWCWLVWSLGLLVLAGCIEPERRRVELVYTYEPAQLLEALRRRADTVTTLKARLNIHFEGPEMEGPRSCDGLLRYQAPDRIRLRGERDFVGEVFDLASDGERYQYRLLDPETRALGPEQTGSVADLRQQPERGLATLSLNLGELLGLVRPPEQTATIKVLVKTYPYHYIIDLVDVAGDTVYPLRQWWLDRVDLTCLRIEAFGASGELVMEAALSDYDTLGPGLSRIATMLRLHWPGSGETLTFELRGLKANQPLKASLFRLRGD